MKPEQITAWALDEASAEERQQLEAALLENPQDKLKADDTKAFCDFLLSELRDDSLALTDKQRERLVAHASQPMEKPTRMPDASGTPALQPPGKAVTRWNIGGIVRLSLAACAVLGGFWTWQAYSGKQTEAHAVVAVAEKPVIKVQLPQKTDAKKKEVKGPEARLLVEAQNKALVKMEPQAAKPLASAPMPAPVSSSSALALNKDQRAMSRGDVEKLKQIQDQNAYGLDFGGTIEAFRIPTSGVVAGTGMITQKVELAAVGAAPMSSDSSGVLVVSGGTLMQQGKGMATINGGTTLTVGGVVSGSPARRLSLISGGEALLKEPQPRPAASLSLKAGYFPEQMAVAGLASDVMEIDGFINLYVPPLPFTTGLLYPMAAVRPRVTPQKTGLAYCLLPGVQMMAANGWPLMPQVQPGVIAASGDLDMAGSMTEYLPSAGIGNLGWFINRGGASLVLKSANGSTCSITVQAGAPLMMNTFLQPRRVPDFRAGCLTFIERDETTTLGGSIRSKSWTPDSWLLEWMQSNPCANSAGLISFATAANSQLNAFRGSGSISTEDRQLLGGLIPRDQLLSGSSVALADDSGVGAIQAAVFNTNGVKKGVDLMSAPTVTTKSGTRVVALGGLISVDEFTIIREELLPPGGQVTGNNSYFKLKGTSDSSNAVGATVAVNAGASLPGATFTNGPMIAAASNSGSTVVTSASGIAETMISELPYPVIYPAKPEGLKISAGKTTFIRPEPTLAFGRTSALPGYMAPHVVLGSGASTVTAANYDINGTSSLEVGTVVSGAPMSRSDEVALSLGDRSNYTGDTTFSGVLTATGGVTFNSLSKSRAPAAPAESGTVTFGGATSATPKEGTTFGATVSGSGGITKSGAGTRVISDIKNYMGTNRFIPGTLQVSNGAAMAAPALDALSPMMRDAGATLDLNSGTLASTTTAVPAAMPAGVAGGWATTDGKDFVTFNSTARGVQNPQAGAAGANTISLSAAAPVTAVKAQVGMAAPAAPMAGGNQFAGANDGGKFMTEFGTYTTTASGVQNSAVDVRYFSLDASSGVASKDLAENQGAFRKTDPTSGESYTRIIENEMKDVAREPLSTLSIDVDTASYANVRRFLNQNMIPPPDAVRIEELVNYFPTSEEGPAHEAKEPFGVRVELAPCPWQPVHRLARISIKGRELDKDRKASNLVFLVDVSGSMNEPAKLPLVQQSLRMLTEQLGEGDRVTMVVYAGSSGVVLPPTNGEKKAEILAAIDRLSAGGSTHGSAGIKLAYEQAVAGFIKGGVNRVILCTDGDFNVGVSSPEELEKLIKHKAKTGVFLSVLGFGSGNLKDRTMETLADKGNGNYAYIDSLSEARKVLVEQMSGTLVTIAKDVKIQVEFNPAAVRSYRLIGYENRLLAKEDFNDDTKDAGEIGAGHSVVALYEVVPANLPPGAEPRPLVDNLKYQAPAIAPAQLVAAAKSGEMMTVKLRYKEPESDLSKLIEVPTKDEGKTLTASSEEFKFSAAVAGFGLLLRDSSYKGTLSWETVRRLALDGKGADKLGYRGEFLQLIDKARGLKETK